MESDEETAVLQQWLKLNTEEADLKRAIREAEATLDQLAYEKYPQLTEAEIQTLVVDDFWPHNTSLWVTSFKENNPKFVFYQYTRLGLELRREKTRALKQGMMQELLTGRTRLVAPSGTTL